MLDDPCGSPTQRSDLILSVQDSVVMILSKVLLPGAGIISMKSDFSSCARFALACMALTFCSEAQAQTRSVTETILHTFGGAVFSDGGAPNGVILGPSGELYGTTQSGGLSTLYNVGTIFRLTPPTPPATTWRETILYEAKYDCGGALPGPGLLVRDANGALYGTTYGVYAGGTHIVCPTVFKLSPPVPPATWWTRTILSTFKDPNRPTTSIYPGPLAIDPKTSVVYGFTQEGGAYNLGMVYKIAPPIPPATNWTRTVLYSFRGEYDGSGPFGAPLIGPDGSLYGVAPNDGVLPPAPGGRNCYRHYPVGCGAVFRLTPPVPPSTRWTETVLYRFRGYNDGSVPQGDLIMSAAGALYGMTGSGGPGNAGTIFKLTPPVPPSTLWVKTTLYAFPTTSTGNPRGASPYGRLVLDSTGAIYGTAIKGGFYGSGVVYKLTPPVPPATAWTQTVLHHFPGPRLVPDGGSPYGLVKDAAGGLFGIASQGGKLPNGDGGWGIVFKLNGAAGP